MTENNRIINGLWIGNELSPLEQLCIQSYINNNHTFQLWVYAEVKNIPDGTVVKNANEILHSDKIFSYTNTNKFGHGKGSYAGFSDIFRYKLLYEFGGWWTDMDVVCLKPLNFTEDYVFRKNGIKGVVGNVLKCSKKSEVMQYCYTNSIQDINYDNKDWMLPIRILNTGIERYNLQHFIKEFTNEDSWTIITKLLTTNNKIQEKWFAIHWMNEEWRRHDLKKDTFVEGSTIQKLMFEYCIQHQLLDKKGINNLNKNLSKWNYRFINLKARINWIVNKLA